MGSRHFSKTVKAVTCLMCMVIVLVSLNPLMVNAGENDERKVVRVGYVSAENYEEGGEGEYKRGFGYEYFQKISYITGWKYEYVYGSFAECYEKLVNGEIDLFGNVSYTEERAKLFYYSDYPEGKDTYWLYASNSRMDLITNDTSKLNGIKIGVTRGSFQEGLLTEWLASRNINAEVVGCDGFEDMMTRADAGTLDAFVAPDLSVNYGYSIITGIGFSEYFFAVSKSRPDILDELNAALYEIQNTESDYNSLLVNRYQYKMASGLTINDDERKWLDEHNNTIRMGILSNYLPFSGMKDGEPTGILMTIAESLQKDYGINVEIVTYDSLDNMMHALKDGEVDLMGPVIGDFYLGEQYDCALTDSIINTTAVMIYKGDNPEESLKSIGVEKNPQFFNAEAVEVLFPDSEIIEFETPNAINEAIADGTVGCTLLPAARINIVRNNRALEDLSIAELSTKISVNMVASMSNRRVASIANKAILHSSAATSGLVLTENSAGEKDITLADFLKQNGMYVLATFIVIIAILAFLIIRLQKALADAKQASRAKTAFLGNMSHDIRTPMNAIMGFTNLLEKHRDEPERVDAYLEKIKSSNEVLLSIINNVLEMTRIEQGTIALEDTAESIETLGNGILDMFNEMMSQKSIAYTRSFNVEHPYAYGDQTKLREVFINLISNAYKYTNPGGSVNIRVDEIPCDRNGYMLLQTTIEDTGIGMSEEYLPHLFEEFTREKNTTDSKVEGTGLGMPIVKRLVELMDGTIDVKSKKGEGTTFVVTIPHRIAEKSECASEGIDISVEDLAGKRILLAEDNDLNAEIAYEILSEVGLIIDRAEDGAICVRMLDEAEDNYYDLVLMDVQMPNMNGYEATRAIRAMNNTAKANIPILAMTANAFEEDKKNALEAGMNGHLSKPINVKAVLEQLSKSLS